MERVLFILVFVSLLDVYFAKKLYITDYCSVGYEKRIIDLSDKYGQVRLKSSQTSSYGSNRNCVITFSAESFYKLMVYFKGTRYKYNGSSYPSTVYTTTGKYLTIKFVSDSNMEYSGVDLIITQFHTGVCTSDEYRCDNGRCIYKSISCTAYNSCGDHSDCNNNTTGTQLGSVVGIVVGTISCIMLITCVLIMIRRRGRGTIVRSRPVQGPRVHATEASATIGQIQMSATPPPPPYSQSQYDNQMAPPPPPPFSQLQYDIQMGPPPPYSQVQYMYPPKKYHPTT